MSKTLLLLLLLALLGLFVLAGCVIQKDIVEPIPDTNTSLSDRELSDKEQCESQGRIWFNEVCIEKSEKCENAGGQLRMFGDGCGDSCGVKPRLCTLALQVGCDCGATQCYDGQQCVADPYEPYATPQEACENTNGNWEIVLPPASGCKTDGDCKPVMCVTTPCPQPKCVNPLMLEVGQCVISDLEQTSCPQFTPPSPLLCEDGKLVSGGFNEKTGCRNHPQCVRPTCQCPEGEVFTTQGCGIPENNLMSIIAYGR